jgi:hypothetical protein
MHKGGGGGVSASLISTDFALGLKEVVLTLWPPFSSTQYETNTMTLFSNGLHHRVYILFLILMAEIRIYLYPDNFACSVVSCFCLTIYSSPFIFLPPFCQFYLLNSYCHFVLKFFRRRSENSEQERQRQRLRTHG